MKKIIKLTESDLTRIVKSIIKENNTKMDLIDAIKDEGFKSASEMVGGDKVLFKILGIKTPMDYLHFYDDLNVVQSEEDRELDLFRYRPKYNLMVYDKKNRYVYIDMDNIWSVLEDTFELEYLEIRKIIWKWLNEVYNLSALTPSWFKPYSGAKSFRLRV